MHIKTGCVLFIVNLYFTFLQPSIFICIYFIFIFIFIFFGGGHFRNYNYNLKFVRKIEMKCILRVSIARNEPFKIGSKKKPGFFYLWFFSKFS
jgi:uncharacterized membrane protein